MFSMAAEAICHVTSSIPQKVFLFGMASAKQATS